MKTPRSVLLIFALFSVVLFSSCDSEEPEEGPGEEELITKVTLILVPTGSEPTARASASDPEGDGLDLMIDTLVVQAGVTYLGGIRFEDELNGEDITEEVEDEDEAHQVFYTVGGANADRLDITITDVDGNGLPVGLDFTVVVTGLDAAEATLNVVLSHYDEEPKNGTDRSDESDVDVTFPVKIISTIPD